MKNIIVLGAGYAGILTAKKLAKKYKNDQSVQITIIDKSTYHTMLTELHEVACERVPEDAIRIPLEKVFYGKDIRVVHDHIKDIDFSSKTLQGVKERYQYDYLVLATGSKPTFFGTPGAAENGFTLWSFEDAITIKNQIHAMFEKASNELDPAERRKQLTFVTIGGGFTGIEMIGELAEFRDRLCRTYGIDPRDVRLVVADMMPKILPIFDDKVIEKASKYLDKMGVEQILNAKIVGINPDAVELEGQAAIPTYTAIWAAGIEGSDIMEEIDGIEKLARNRIQTDAHLRSVTHQDVFVAGDNLFYVPEGEERPVPQMVENAEHSAKTVYNNIVNTIENKSLEEYKPNFHGAMVCIGGRYGVAQLNTKTKKFHLSGFFAMFVKHFINLVYFIQVAGFNKVWTYLNHEIFHVEDRRAFTGGFFSKRSPNFFLVPLRIFLGVMWLLQGLDKVKDVLENPNEIFLIPMSPDAMTAATSGAEAASDVILLKVPGFLQTISNWGMDLLFWNADGSFNAFAPIFQGMMVAGEIVIGLLLIGGLFTMLASIASIAMTVMIYFSGWAELNILWYTTASIATLTGAGHTFGLDYWVMPWLRDTWAKTKFGRKNYLYADRHRGW